MAWDPHRPPHKAQPSTNSTPFARGPPFSFPSHRTTYSILTHQIITPHHAIPSSASPHKAFPLAPRVAAAGAIRRIIMSRVVCPPFVARSVLYASARPSAGRPSRRTTSLRPSLDRAPFPSRPASPPQARPIEWSGVVYHHVSHAFLLYVTARRRTRRPKQPAISTQHSAISRPTPS